LGLELCSTRGADHLGPAYPMPVGLDIDLLDAGLLDTGLLDILCLLALTPISCDCQASSPLSAPATTDCLAALGGGSKLQSRGDNVASPRASVVPPLPSSPPPNVYQDPGHADVVGLVPCSSIDPTGHSEGHF
jgi:hypothetical protein